MRHTFIRIGLMLLVLSLTSSFAQSLVGVLPADTTVALGTVGLRQHEERLAPFIEEFERLELGEALAAVFGADGRELTVDNAAFPDVGILELIGDEAWIALSLSRFNPLPAVTLVARPSAEANARIASGIAQAEGLETLREGDITFYQQTLDEPELTVSVIAFAQVDDVVVISSNPDTLRAILRQLSGATEPSFTSSAGYQATLGTLEPGTLYGYLDYAQIGGSLAPLARGVGFDQLVRRLEQSFATAGVSAGVIRVTDTGLQQESIQRPDQSGGDSRLYALLTETATVQADADGVPAEVLSWSVGANTLPAWWDYLNDITRSTPELGGTLNELVQSFFGIDVNRLLFSWMGPQITTISTGVGEVTQPGVPSSNLLGESVYLIEATDPAAAETGLQTLLQTLGTGLAAFTDPMGQAGNLETTTQEIAGVSVTTVTITSGITLSYAVRDNTVIIATSPDAMVATLSPAAPLSATPQFEELTRIAPETARTYALSDNQRTLEDSAAQLTSQLQLLVGLSGGANLDFEAVETASERLSDFISFIAERLGSSLSYSGVRNGIIYSYSETEIRW
jgi:hypothetical protein